MSVSILVVDDEPDVADLFHQHFRREARQGTYVMHFATSGAEALNRLSGEIEPSLIAVLSDINMPGMDGLELLGEIKQHRPDLPVMMVTAYGDDERRRRARKLGACEFITKPVDFDQLPSIARRSGLAVGHPASPEANRRPDRRSLRCSGLRQCIAFGTTTGVTALSRSIVSLASSSRPICA
jgi:CheY-like chemotaxis protein